MFFPQISSRSFYIGARGRAQGEPPPLRPTSGARTVAQKMGWTETMRTRPWTGTPRACGAQISSRAFRRPLPSTLPVAGGRSSCQTRGRCTVSTAWSSQSEHRKSANCLWLKDDQQPPQSFIKKRVKYFSSSWAGVTEVNVLLPHKALSNKSVPVVLRPRGRFFQSHQHSQSWLLWSWEHLSPLIYTCLVLQSLYSLFWFTASPHFQTRHLLCFVLSLNITRLFLPTLVLPGEFCP